MDKMDLKKYGITGVTEIVYNPSYDELFREETKKGLRGFEKGQLTETGAVNVMTGVYTGRSPKDKFFVMDETTKDTIWWTSDEYKNDNKPVTKAAWKELKKIASKELSGKKLYVVDTSAAHENTRLKIRFIMEVAWQAHFVKNMFIRPTDAELENYGEPDFVVLNASKAKVKEYKKLGLNSETAVVFNLTEKMQVIINTWYGGEMKKGMFSYMNYLLPLKGIASMHCSANTNEKGETAIFFGLSGTGKTTLSTDPKRQLIGDDEHGWDDDGVFNFEGGCYAKVINLSQENEPRHLERHPPQRAAGERDGGQEGQDRLCRQVGNREHPRFVPDLPHRQYREARIEGPGCQEGDLPFGRRLRRTAPGFDPDAGTDQILLPLGLHRQVGRYRARYHRADADLLGLLRCGVPLAASDQVR